MRRAFLIAGMLVFAGFLVGCNSESGVNEDETSPEAASAAAAQMPGPMSTPGAPAPKK